LEKNYGYNLKIYQRMNNDMRNEYQKNLDSINGKGMKENA